MNNHPGGAGQHGHLDPDTAAEFRAGLIGSRGLVKGRRGRAIAAHLAGCADCGALGDRLAEVSALLAAAPVPSLPDALARRLDSALAAEVQHSGSPERASVPPPGHHRSSAWADVFQLRRLAPIAAALALLGGVGYGLSQLSGRSASSAADSGGAAAAQPAAGTAGGTHAASGASFSPDQRERAGSAAGAAPVEMVSSDIDYQPATLAQQVKGQLAIRSSLHAGPASLSIAACVRNVSKGGQLELAESARYAGHAATIIVVSRSTGVQALVAGPGCSATRSDILAMVVLS